MLLLKLSPVRSQKVVGCQGEIFKAAVPLIGRAKVGLVTVARGAVAGEPALFANLEYRKLPRGGLLVKPYLSLEGREVGLVRVAHGAVGGRVSVTGSIGKVSWNWVAGQRQALATKPAARLSNEHCRALTRQKGAFVGLEAVQSGAEAWPSDLHADARAPAS